LFKTANDGQVNAGLTSVKIDASEPLPLVNIFWQSTFMQALIHPHVFPQAHNVIRVDGDFAQAV
tara:strand:- start:832 stop:1023 length:192 start_codon:yes stop_codon:yes gene_type:complete